MTENDQPDKVKECLTAEEMTRIANLMRKLTKDFDIYNPCDDIRILDRDGDALGYVEFCADMEQYIFIPKGTERDEQ